WRRRDTPPCDQRKGTRAYDGRFDLGDRRLGCALRAGGLEAFGGGDGRGAVSAAGWRPDREMVSEGTGNCGEAGPARFSIGLWLDGGQSGRGGREVETAILEEPRSSRD